MTGILSRDCYGYKFTAQEAYEYADEMMKEAKRRMAKETKK